MIELCCEYLSVRCIWLYVLIVSRTHFRMNPHSLFAWMSKNSSSGSSCDIFSLSDCKWTRTHNNLIRKRTLHHLANLAEWFSCVVSAFLGGAFDCMFLLCHVRISEWIHILCFPECLGTVLFKTGALCVYIKKNRCALLPYATDVHILHYIPQEDLNLCLCSFFRKNIRYGTILSRISSLLVSFLVNILS